MRGFKKMAKLLLTFAVIFGVWKAASGVLTAAYIKAADRVEADIENTVTSNPSWMQEAVQIVANTEKDTEAEPNVSDQTDRSETSDTSVAFVDVGQGDSIVISDNGHYAIIDTGKYEGYDNLETYLDENGIYDIDALVLTHPDADHIQNAPEIIRDYTPETVYMTDVTSDTKTYQNLTDAISDAETETVYPEAGDFIDFGGSSSYEVLGPVYTYDDTNSSSLVIKMTNGSSSYLFTGDATGEEMQDIMAAGYDISADVYKASHHGSANDGCNSEGAINTIDPEYAVISCGYENDYGHPHSETMDIFKTMGIKIFRTDLQGTIVSATNGDGLYTWSAEPCTDYRSGNYF